MFIGFTGSQKGMTDKQRIDFRTFLERHTVLTFTHGDCIGSDKQAHDMVREIQPKTEIVIRPCNIEKKRAFCAADITYDAKPPLERNRDIVNHCNMLIATPSTIIEQRRSGTWATIRYAQKTGKLLMILIPR